MPTKSSKGKMPGERQHALENLRRLKMAKSAHRFVRGSTQQFYQWLDGAKTGDLPDGPNIWICGDCHVGNLGPIASVNGKIAIQIRDFDQTVIGHPAHDILRLALSLASAARSSNLPGVATPLMMESLIAGYESAFAPELDAQAESKVPRTLRASLRDSAAANWNSLARERIKDPTPKIPLGRKFWPLTDDERAEIAHACEQPSIQRLARQLKSRDDEASVKLVDAAYWVKGCSSLGKLRFAAVLEVNGGDRSYCLIDFKEAAQSAAPTAKGATMPSNPAERVEKGAKNLSPHLGERLAASNLCGKSVFVRELCPQDLKLDLDQIEAKEATEIAAYLGSVVGLAHSRQLGASDRTLWLKELKKTRTEDLDAPNWLWRGVVDLLAVHEKAYLEHCRRYALDGE
jgi:uncharacterized protein (DUF2252 family)